MQQREKLEAKSQPGGACRSPGKRTQKAQEDSLKDNLSLKGKFTHFSHISRRRLGRRPAFV